MVVDEQFGWLYDKDRKQLPTNGPVVFTDHDVRLPLHVPKGERDDAAMFEWLGDYTFEQFHFMATRPADAPMEIVFRFARKEDAALFRLFFG